MITVTDSVTIPESEIEWSYARSGGPGGQNVNKVASKTHLRWHMAPSEAVSQLVKNRLAQRYPSLLTAEGDLLITSQEYRDQERNRQRCVEKLISLLRLALVPPKPRVKTKPTKAANARRMNAKRLNAQRKTGRRPPNPSDG